MTLLLNTKNGLIIKTEVDEMLKFNGTEKEFVTNRDISKKKQGGISNAKNFYLCHQEKEQVITDISFIRITDAVNIIEKHKLKGFAIIRGKELLNYPDGWDLLPGKKLQDFIE